MAKYSKQNKISSETQDEALKIARGNQKPGQTKEQTKLIAQGIQKGIEQYKKQYKAKSRALNKQLKKANPTRQDKTEIIKGEPVNTSPRWLPWTLLFGSWIVFVVYLFLGKS